MKLIYIANARIPTDRAHGAQIIKTCEALAENLEIELVLPGRFNEIKESPFDYYDIEKPFKIKKLFCLDLIVLDKYLGHLGLWVEGFSFFLSVFFYLFFKKADIIYTRDKLLLPFICFKKNIVWEVHTFPKNYFLYSTLIKRLKGVVVITQKLKDLFIGRGIKAGKIVVAPDGVDLEKFQVPSSKFQVREKLGLPQDKKIVLYAGHLYPWKGVDVLAEASQFLPDNTEVYLVGGAEDDIKNYKLQTTNYKLHILGHRPYSEIPYWLKAADVLVLPNSGREEISKYWTSPLKMFEYMASGVPIVASDLPSIREVLNEENAILVEPDYPQGLAQGIKRALEDIVLSDKIREKALNDVRNYTWRRRAEKILDCAIMKP